MKRIRITVTAEDIAYGVPCKSNRCPIALAILRSTGASHVSVSATDWTAWHTDDGSITGHLPNRAQKFVARFDDEEAVQPSTFVLSVDPA